MYECNLSHDGHTRRFQIKALMATGWEVREEEDSHVVSSRVYDDCTAWSGPALSFVSPSDSSSVTAGW